MRLWIDASKDATIAAMAATFAIGCLTNKPMINCIGVSVLFSSILIAVIFVCKNICANK